MSHERIEVEHPGIFLKEDFLEPLDISEYRLAKDISVPPRRINEIIKGKRSITPDTALEKLGVRLDCYSVRAISSS